MRITRHTDYAFRVLMYVALKRGQIATISEIAERYDISRHHLTKVVNKLNQKGHLTATRGKNGGLTLDAPPESINLGRVFRDMESETGVVECIDRPEACVLSPSCSLQGVFRGAMNGFMAVLDQHTLNDLLPPQNDGKMRDLLAIEL